MLRRFSSLRIIYPGERPQQLTGNYKNVAGICMLKSLCHVKVYFLATAVILMKGISKVGSDLVD